MISAYKTEINPTQEQRKKIKETLGTCRYVYNLYISQNKERHENGQKFISGVDFSKWLNNDYIPNNPDKAWIKNVSSKAVKQSIMNAEKAFKNFFNHKAGFPKYKKKNVSEAKMYFVKNDAKTKIGCDRHRIKIPILGWIQIKEKGYLPTEKEIKSGTVSYKAGRYYVSVIVDEAQMPTPRLNEFGIGVDLGIKELGVCSNGVVIKNINKSKKVKKLEKKLKREQRKLSKKHKNFKKKNKPKGEATRQNIEKQSREVQRVHQRLNNIRIEHINKAVRELVKAKPTYIVIEDLNISGMMKNRHLSKAIAHQKLFEFRRKLECKCKQYGIELRIVDRFYPSSKTCHECGNIKSDLKLCDRVYICECGYKEDRDYNASLNLRDAKIYKEA